MRHKVYTTISERSIIDRIITQERVTLPKLSQNVSEGRHPTITNKTPTTITHETQQVREINRNSSK
jgi:hypothetical protein